VEGGYQYHDWGSYQPTRAEKEAERKAGAERQARWRERRQQEREARDEPADERRDQTPDKPRDQHETNAASNGVTDTLRDGTRNAYPDPTRPDPTVVPTELLEAPHAAPPTTKRSTRGTRIPDDFAVTPEMVAWAQREAPHVDGRRETEKFVNYWRAKAGRDATKLDWVRTWRNWMLTAEERAPAARNGQDGRLSGGMAPASNAPPRIPADERCPKHPSYRVGKCGACRADAVGGSTLPDAIRNAS
jgi:hypothetical protein